MGYRNLPLKPINRLFCCTLFSILALLVASIRGGDAQSLPTSYTRRPLSALKVSSPPTIDGDLSDLVWKTAPKAETFTDIQNGGVVADQTTAYLVYDDKYLYVGFYCKDSKPDQITARESVQDQKYANEPTDLSSSQFKQDNEDNIEFVIDPFETHRAQDMTRFSLNAIGTRSARLGGGRGGKVEWKGDWAGAVKRLPDGWSAELRIPWAILNYPQSRLPVNMGLNFQRFQLRTHLVSAWSNIGAQSFYDLEGRWTDVQVPQAKFRPQISVLPYLLPGVSGRGQSLFTGVDARFTMTPELTAVGSVNPDFATVESAIQTVQFVHTEQFLPERRPFFLEGRDYFAPTMKINDIGSFFYPNRISTFDVGEKIYGKVTPTDTLGFLHTVDWGHRTDVVARYQHEISPTAQSGLMFLHKSQLGDNNTVGVFDHHARWGKAGFETWWALTSGDGAGGSAKAFSVTYEDKLLSGAIQYYDLTDSFRVADGFLPFNQFHGFVVAANWGAEWREGFWRSFQVSALPLFWKHNDGSSFLEGPQMTLNFDTRSDWRFEMDLTNTKFDGQRDANVGFEIHSGVSNRFRHYGLRVQLGTVGDRQSTVLGPIISTRLFRKLDVSYGGVIENRLGLAHQHIMSLNYEISPQRSFGGRVVVQNSDTNAYLFYRHSGGRGTETYLILGDPNATRTVKSLQIKFVFAL